MLYDILLPEEIRQISNVIAQSLNEKFMEKWGSGYTFRITDQDICDEIEELSLINEEVETRLSAKLPDFGFLNKKLVINCVNRYLEKETQPVELKFDL